MWVDDFLEGLKPNTITLGLERIRVLSDRLGIAHRANNILVAGTNGKGSTCAYLASILKHAQIRCGLFTSPHLVDVRERIVVDGAPVSEEDFTRLMRAVAGAMEGMSQAPTYFEALTAAAMLYFQEKQTALNILEVGLGGRYDAVNLYPAALSLVTPVSLDHMPALGRTLTAIAFEKAGIIKEGAPVIASAQRPAALKILRKQAADSGSPLKYLPDGVSSRFLRMEPEGMAFEMELCGCRHAVYTVLLGRHQMENAALAVAAARYLSERFTFPLTCEAVAAGIARTRWRGRLQVQRVGAKSFLTDAAHNVHGARTLARALKALGRSAVPLYFCAMRDKRPLEQLRALEPLCGEIHLLSIPKERSVQPAQWERLRKKLKHPRVVIHEDLNEGFSHALRNGSTPLLTGSIYFLGEFFSWLNRLP